MYAHMDTRPCELMRAARLLAGKSQYEIATELGVAQALVSKWETGKGWPSTKNIRRVAKAYGLLPEQLLPRAAA
jgi:transcriptional regulator with XRE-family HTH domain